MSILSRIKDVFRGSSRGRPEVAGVRRIPSTESPFGVEIWDCGAFTHHMVSTTGSAEVAQRYVQLRSSRGDEYRAQEPVAAHKVSCDLTYPYPGHPPEGPLFKSEQMEDKWDVYLFDDVLYFARSWTGELTYKAEVQFDGGQMHLTAIAVGQSQDANFAPRIVDYLIKSHLLHRDMPHPLPAGLPAMPDQIAAYSFSMFGRRCSHGTFADTTIIQLPGPLT